MVTYCVHRQENICASFLLSVVGAHFLSPPHSDDIIIIDLATGNPFPPHLRQLIYRSTACLLQLASFSSNDRFQWFLFHYVELLPCLRICINNQLTQDYNSVLCVCVCVCVRLVSLLNSVHTLGNWSVGQVAFSWLAACRRTDSAERAKDSFIRRGSIGSQCWRSRSSVHRCDIVTVKVYRCSSTMTTLTALLNVFCFIAVVHSVAHGPGKLIRLVGIDLELMGGRCCNE